jgi:hypothetical protein
MGENALHVQTILHLRSTDSEVKPIRREPPGKQYAQVVPMRTVSVYGVLPIIHLR